MGSLSVNNSVTNFSRLGTFKVQPQEYRLPSPPLNYCTVMYCMRVSLRTVKIFLAQRKGSWVISIYSISGRDNKRRITNYLLYPS